MLSNIIKLRLDKKSTIVEIKICFQITPVLVIAFDLQ